ncbi:MAG: hypothetical protein ABI165_06585 [Bryobacteraceae bacterium]
MPVAISPRVLSMKSRKTECGAKQFLAGFLVRAAPFALLTTCLAGSALRAGSNKLTLDDRIEIIRGLDSEFATSRILLPRSKKPLNFESAGNYDKSEWNSAAQQFGPAARTGDQVQITKVAIEKNRILLEINHGLKGGAKWYQNIEVGMGGGMTPVGRNQSTASPGGTLIALDFPGPVPELTAAEIKKLLAPILDFDKHSPTETYAASLSPAVQKAVKENRAIVGMNRDEVLLALGKPVRKIREETKDGDETEDWIYGQPPGKITFVTFEGSKVIKVKDDFAGLGGSVAGPADTPSER